MKKYISIVLVSFILACCLGAYLETFVGDWTPIRSAVTADDTALDGTTEGYTYAFASKPALAVSLSERTNHGEMYFYATAAADKTAAIKVWAWKRDGPARLLYAGTVTTGTAVTGTADTYYIDTITDTTNNNSCVVYDSGNNRVAVLNIGDLRGYSFLYCEVDVTAGQITALTCEFTAY